MKGELAAAGQALRFVLGDELVDEAGALVKEVAAERVREFAATPLGQAVSRELRAHPDARPEETLVGALKAVVQENVRRELGGRRR